MSEPMTKLIDEAADALMQESWDSEYAGFASIAAAITRLCEEAARRAVLLSNGEYEIYRNGVPDGLVRAVLKEMFPESGE